MDLTLSTIAAMCRQEESGYTITQTIPLLLQQQHETMYTSSSHFPAHLSEAAAMMMIDEDCRTKMAAWCYQVVDFCKFNRETVEIAMNFLDRFIATQAGKAALMDRKVYQLSAMTCLYTAVKIHEPEAMDPTLVSNLSRGTYSPQQIEQMEATILMALQWRVNPPTALGFVRQFLELLPTSVVTESLRQTVYDLTKYQTELAVNEAESVTLRASTVAFCALMNSLESVGLHSTLLLQIGNGLSQSVGLYSYYSGANISSSSSSNDDMILGVQTWLFEAVQRQPACVASKLRLSLRRRPFLRSIPSPPSSFGSSSQEKICCETSPRSIATYQFN